MKRPLLLVLLTVVAVSVAFSGCGSKSESSSTTGATGTPQRGGILRVATHNTILPQIGYPAEMTASTSWFSQEVLETLIHVDLAGKVIPKLATDVNLSADGKTLTLKLRQGVKFHDGTDFNSEAAKWNLDTILATNTARLSAVQSVEVVDPYTIKLNLKQFDNTLYYDLSRQAGMMISPTAVEKNGIEWAKTNPVGTGPFKFKSFTRDVGVEYERFDGYWKPGLPYLDGITWTYIESPSVSMAALKAGTVDIVNGEEDKETSELVAEGFTLPASTATDGIVGLAPDSKNPNSCFADVRVRQAIEYAIDKKAIVEAFGYGLWVTHDQIAPTESYAYDPTLAVRGYDPAKAKELLAEAGYANGLKINIYWFASMHEDTPVAVQAQLAEVGIDATIKSMDFPGIIALRAEGTMEPNSVLIMFLFYQPEWLVDLNLSLASTASDFHDLARPAGFDALLQQAIAAKDFDTKKALTQKVLKLAYDEAMVIPMYHTTRNNVYDAKRVRDITFEGGEFTFAESAWLSQ
jgi:peptide/nickel transport system substrate-binding protein